MLVALFATVTATAWARPFIVLVFNVENLFDADGRAAFVEYQPSQYSRAHVLTKLRNIAEVVAQFEGGAGPDVLLLQELEVDQTPARRAMDADAFLRRYAAMRIEEMLGPEFDDAVADLPAEMLLLKAMADRGVNGYRVVTAEREVAKGSGRMLAQQNVVFTRFPVKDVRSHPTVDARPILEVLVEVEGAPLYLFNNHWKSGASDAETEKTRIENARTLRNRLSEILKRDPHADVIVAGDFNAHYNQKQRHPEMKRTGINDVLGSQGNELAVRGERRDLYNLWFELPVDERGSDAFRDEWGTLMQMMVTRGLYDYRGVQYVDNSFGVAKIAGLNVDAKGLPKRWSFEGPQGAGVSDHFPIYAKFTTVRDDREDRWIALRGASVENMPPPGAEKIDYSKIDVERLAQRVENLAVGAPIRVPENKGKLWWVEGTIEPGKRLTVRWRGEVYDLWSFDAALREKLRRDHEAGETIRFYGELGQFKERWQFVVHDESWVR